MNITPGKWVLDKLQISATETIAHVQSQRFTATVSPGFNCPMDEVKANARAIAAVPDMIAFIRVAALDFSGIGSAARELLEQIEGDA